MTPEGPADPLGLEPGVVRLVEYDSRWPALFVAERRRIRDHCGALISRVEHIGGTSIPGMCAKPVLDMAVARSPDAEVAECVAAFARAGYEYRGERGVPGRHFLHRGQPRSHHVHLVDEDGSLWRDYLDFRDHLRAHGDDARRFADVKRVLAARFSLDREAYMDAKSAHVQEILRAARALRE
jgi:GrpB-like predicted nucleotidyltransferase (UPF0157 family)